MIKDITGQRSGKLVALSILDRSANNGGRYWLCQCDCGNKAEVRGCEITNGARISCGCVSGRFTVRDYCPKGHDTRNPESRDKTGHCKQCTKIKNARYWRTTNGQECRWRDSQKQREKYIKRDENLIQVLNERLEYLNEVIDNVEKVRG